MSITLTLNLSLVDKVSKTMLRKLLAQVGTVVYLDYRAGHNVGHVQYSSPEAAEAAAALSEDSRWVGSGPVSLSVLRGAEEVAYLKICAVILTLYLTSPSPSP